MAQPEPYAPQHDFSAAQTLNPTDPVSGTELDQEFANLETTLSGVLDNLALLQDDDGTLREGVVDVNALAAEVVDLFSGDASDGVVVSVQGQQGHVILVPSDIDDGTTIPDDDTPIWFTNTERDKLVNIQDGAQINRAIASQAQSEAGLDNTTAMTPLRTKQAIDALANVVASAAFLDVDPLPTTLVFDKNKKYADFTMVGNLSLALGPRDSSWINGSQAIAKITGDGNTLTFGADFIDEFTGLNGDIPTPDTGESLTYEMRFLEVLDKVWVRTIGRDLRADGKVKATGALDMDGQSVLNANRITATGQIKSATGSIAYASSVTLNFSTRNNFKIAALTGDITLNDPSGADAGAQGVIEIDNSGGHTVSLGTAFKILDGQSTTIGTGKFLLTYYVLDASNVAYSIRSLP